MKRVVVKKNGRNKAFIGAIVGAVANIAGNAISAKKQKKAQDAQFKLEQDEQYRLDGINQANAMSTTYANQEYVDQYNSKITLKAGGKMKLKKGKSGDRIEQAKKFAIGGKTKRFKDGGSIDVGAEVAAGIGGLGSLATSIFTKPAAPRMIKKADGFNYGKPKTMLTPNSYTLDGASAQLPAFNTDVEPFNPNTVNTATNLDRLRMAKMGKSKKINKSL